MVMSPECEERGAWSRHPRTAYRQEAWGKGAIMPTSNSHSDDATAIRDALLDTYEKTMATLPVSAVRTAIRLDSFKLGWLANVWAFFAIVRSGIRWARPAASDEEAVRRYAEVSGKSHDGSQVDVDRIIGQLTLIDERAPYWHRPELAALKPAARAELLATADAVVQYFLDGRQSDDALLTEMQAPTLPASGPFSKTWILPRRALIGVARASQMKRCATWPKRSGATCRHGADGSMIANKAPAPSIRARTRQADSARSGSNISSTTSRPPAADYPPAGGTRTTGCATTIGGALLADAPAAGGQARGAGRRDQRGGYRPSAFQPSRPAGAPGSCPGGRLRSVDAVRVIDPSPPSKQLATSRTAPRP